MQCQSDILRTLTANQTLVLFETPSCISPPMSCPKRYFSSLYLPPKRDLPLLHREKPQVYQKPVILILRRHRHWTINSSYISRTTIAQPNSSVRFEGPCQTLHKWRIESCYGNAISIMTGRWKCRPGLVTASTSRKHGSKVDKFSFFSSFFTKLTDCATR